MENETNEKQACGTPSRGGDGTDDERVFRRRDGAGADRGRQGSDAGGDGLFGRIIRKRKFARDYPYEKKMLLTAAEYRFYKVLKEQCDRHRLLICPKVRMEDFLSVTDRRNRNRYRGFIKSRHIDFILCDRDLHMLAGVELDDASHNTPAAERTDAFKDHVFKKIGLPLYRVPAAPGQYTARIRKIIDELI